jgi:hypothetical protein
VWFAGVDLGATYVKGAALDVDALALRRVVRAPFPSFAGSGPVRELDASLALADSAARVATVVGTFRLDAATKAAPPAGAERSTPSPLASSLRSPQPAAT